MSSSTSDFKSVLDNIKKASLDDTVIEFEERPKTDMLPKGNKNDKFSRSREAKEEFVNRIAELMVELGKSGDKWHAGWKKNGFVGCPFCAATSRPYSGVNAMMLMLTSMVKGYQDDRWMTFKQMNAIKEKDPENLKNMHIRKGEKGVSILRPDPVSFMIDQETGKWIFLNKEQISEILKCNETLPEDQQTEIHSYIIYHSFTVFNAAQIECFPAKEKIEEDMQELCVARNAMLEKFFASSGVEVRHYGNQPCFSRNQNIIVMPIPAAFESQEEYYSAKLHEFFHATGHESRENRLKGTYGTKDYAFEEMRAELFSALASAHLGLPITDRNSAAYISGWNKKFSGGDVHAVFSAARDASKILTLLAQFENHEQPGLAWFPKEEMWPELIEAQKERDMNDKVVFAEKEEESELCVTP